MEAKHILIALVALAFIETVIKASVVKRETTLSHVEAIYSRFKNIMPGVDGTYNGEYHSGGYCTLDPLPPMAIHSKEWIRVAAGPETYQKSLGCGMCLEITAEGVGSGNDPIVGKIKAVIVDECAGGCGKNGLDFYLNGDGRWKISYVAIDCPTKPGSDGKVQLRFQGSNAWYIKLQARNTKVPTAGIEVKVKDKWHCLKRKPDNYFVGTGLGEFSTPLHVRLTAITGEQVETSIPEIKDNFSFPTSVQFKGINNGGSK
ncbi:hypothetical protein OS493_031408 [Desmophyllum pertusum]|uniref:Expansin-like EG45 domain-containing protein n=1 Tax=Desmophyllum pertusum TaxID=174260 RepID=A0A9X0CD54_9CNID|nr:hypothetical protein OS493_031408 [Desmophyllum pertusum]